MALTVTHLRGVGFVAVMSLVAACGGAGASIPAASHASSEAASPSAAATDTAAATATATATAAVASGAVSDLFANVQGFDVSPVDAATLDGFRVAVDSSVAGSGQLGDLDAARADGQGAVEMFAFTLVPAAGSTEDAMVDRLLDAIAGGVGGQWVADTDRGVFVLDHDGDRQSIFGPWGTIQGRTVFLYVTGYPAESVDQVADALLGG